MRIQNFEIKNKYKEENESHTLSLPLEITTLSIQVHVLLYMHCTKMGSYRMCTFIT